MIVGPKHWPTGEQWVTSLQNSFSNLLLAHAVFPWSKS